MQLANFLLSILLIESKKKIEVCENEKMYEYVQNL